MKKGFRIIKFKKNKPIFELKDVSKSFDGRPILKKISMEMHPGEIVGLLGKQPPIITTTVSVELDLAREIYQRLLSKGWTKTEEVWTKGDS